MYLSFLNFFYFIISSKTINNDILKTFCKIFIFKLNKKVKIEIQC